MLNKDKAASVYFEKAINANPEYGPSYIMLGDCYLREGKYKEAVEVISKDSTLSWIKATSGLPTGNWHGPTKNSEIQTRHLST